LRAGLAAVIEGDLPEREVALPPAGSTLPVGALFPQARALWLEIGFGGGEHLVAQAAAHPDVGFLGVEVFLNGLASCLRDCRTRGLANVRVFRGDARLLLPALPAASVEKVFLLFPDPWPKARHHKRRFVQPDALDELARVLVPGGEFRLATDDSGYAVWMLRHLMADRNFSWGAAGPEDWRRRPADWPPTRYERKALAAGKPTCYLSFRRVPAGEST